MHKSIKYIIWNIVTVFTVTMFFSCKGNLKEVQKIGALNKNPIGIAENYVLKYTDSTKLVAVVSGPLYKDFSNQQFPYREFPEGFHVDFYDEDNQKSSIEADYGIIYLETELIDMKGNVVLKTHDGRQLLSDQLYWDQQNQWVFTEGNYTFISEDLNIQGVGIDFNRDFTLVNSHGNTGDALFEEKQEE